MTAAATMSAPPSGASGASGEKACARSAGSCSTAMPPTPRKAAASLRGVSSWPGSISRARSASQTGKVAKSTADSPDGIHCWAAYISA